MQPKKSADMQRNTFSVYWKYNKLLISVTAAMILIFIISGLLTFIAGNEYAEITFLVIWPVSLSLGLFTLVGFLIFEDSGI
ncbi:MAG: hypothetical protein WC365_03700 [Candidatus Babeliales bacterium]|jgi:hypothetical protein